MSESTELMVMQQGNMSVMPVMSIRDAVDRHKMMVGFVREIMHKGSDYGVVPGTNTKPVLFKPGAEKLTTFFGLVPRFVIVEKTEDWGDSERESLFYYWFKCELYRNGQIVGEADGSCSSRESKYRYRKAARKCPACGSEAIIKGKQEYGGGWLCWAKKDGCGAKFKDGDKQIEDQKVGRVLNVDVADLANTVLKMAQKRALVAATLITVNASEFFTQDMEDTDYSGVIDGQFVEQGPTKGSGAPAKATEPLPSDQWDTIAPPTSDTELWGGEMWRLIGFEHKNHAANVLKGYDPKNAGERWAILLEHQVSKLPGNAPAEPSCDDTQPGVNDNTGF